MSEARSWSDTSPCVVEGGQDVAADVAWESGEIGRFPFIGGIAISWAHRLPRKPAEGQGPLSLSG